jgi:hypothetical protein
MEIKQFESTRLTKIIINVALQTFLSTFIRGKNRDWPQIPNDGTKTRSLKGTMRAKTSPICTFSKGEKVNRTLYNWRN